MSGIFGIFNTDGKPVVKKELERMAEGLSFIPSAGPAIQVDGPVGIGALLPHDHHSDRRSSPSAQSPSKGPAVVADARLYNRLELLQEFKIPPSLRSDCSNSDLIRMSYQRWGANCPRHLDGEFTFALWDPGKRAALLCKGSFGS